MADDEIRSLKVVLGVTTDVELARALGVERSSISQWKRRGSVPRKYRALLGLEGRVAEANRVLNTTRHTLFGRTENHYWLKAALAFLPDQFRDRNNASLADLGREREGPLMLLASLAMAASAQHLGKARCESEEDYEALITAMLTHEVETIAAILSAGQSQSPQSESSIGPERPKTE